MASKNLVILIGNLSRDPEMRYTADGTAVANFTVATSEQWKDKNGEKQERTEWVKIVAWRRLGEICGEYLSKGSQVYIEGKLQTRSYEKDGEKRYITEVVAQAMQMLGGSRHREDTGSYDKNLPVDYPDGTSMPDDDIPF